MNTSDPQTNPSPDPEDSNPLEFWVAYIPGEGEKKNYLSDGKGNLRIFKSEGALRDWLKTQLRQEVYEMVVVHPVQGQIAIPDDGTLGQIPYPVSKPLRWSPGGIPFDTLNLKPITTLAPPSSPTAQELLEATLKRRRRRRRS
jgi:hypothetical protein